MEGQILDILKSKKQAMTVYDLNDALNLKTTEDLRELLKTLEEMEKSLKIFKTKKNKYILFSDSHLKVGTYLATKKNFGFVDIEGDEDIFIAPPYTSDAIHGDKVVVEITSKNNIKPEGRIVRIVDRELKQMVGEFYYDEDNIAHINLDDEKVKINIIINPEKTMGAMNGHKVLVQVKEKIKNKGNIYNGEVLKILGHKNDPGVDITSIVNQLHISDTFSDEVMEEVEKIPMSVSDDEMKNRRDLREKEIFTIDGSDTKDIDDAISIEKLSNGNHKLGVHIADVSYYVKEGSKIDEEAYERGTSVYLVDRVIPMLPHKLSNGICSLNPNVDRLAISCEMEIDALGNIVDYDIFESVIKSKKQMTYENVNKILENGEKPDGYEQFVDTLKEMEIVAKQLRTNKENKGYIDFDIEEAKILVDEKGVPTDIKVRERGTGEKLIEDFMIAANETVATNIYFMELPFIYRIHGEPNEEKIQSFLKFINVLGYKINGKIKGITPKTMQKILDDLKDKKEYNMLANLLLRSMQKAVYDKNNIGHFGLASKCYTHFTSPIRRYPDTNVHRLLRTYLFNHDLSVETINYWDNKLPFLTKQCSDRERNAIECEREVDDMKKAEYMTKHIGEEFTGIISSVLQFGMFVELDNLIEGLVRLDDLKDDFYIFEEDSFSIVGRRTKKRYRLGDTVKVIVKDANKEARTVDFTIAEKKGNKIKTKKM